MGTANRSKIKTARPRYGAYYPCRACGEAIFAGEEYFSYATGQRSSQAICLTCARTVLAREPEPAYQAAYRERYGMIVAGRTWPWPNETANERESQ